MDATVTPAPHPSRRKAVLKVAILVAFIAAAIAGVRLSP